ncbi:ATP-dependent Clp protease proteolytic subunit- protein 4, chloroplastic, variant 2 [Trebouxia sp. C0010 RCD-2024]
MTYGYTEWANSLVDHNPKHRCLPHCSYMLSMQVTSCCQTLRAHPYHARSLLVNTHCLHAVHSNFSCGSRLPQLRQHSHKVTTKCRSASRLDVQAVIPQLQGDATEQTPPDLPSYLFKERIVYLGMSLVPAVTELILAELLYLQYDNPTRPVYMYINSAGVTKGGEKLGYESEAFAIYDTMKYIKPSVRTLCVGTAFGESAMLLAAGEKGQRGSLPSASIMLRQPMQRFTQMQASDIDIYRNEIRKTKNEIVSTLLCCVTYAKESSTQGEATWRTHRP